MKNKKAVSLIFTAVILVLSLSFAGCGTEQENTDNTQPSTPSIKDDPLYDGINSCIENIVMADKTNDMEYELKKYPTYYIESEFGGEEEFEKIVKDNFYTCDTEYEISEITDVTEKQAEKMETEIKDYYDVDLDIQKVAKVDVSYKYTNYSKDGYIDDSTLVPTTEYYIQFDNTWYYGWGLEMNSEIIEQEIE
ncbi:MAG: hypothetical protein ACI4RL_04370 [Ruminococcus sp.]